MKTKVTSSAPSNIALIKYMGKLSSETNVPTNSSLSYTLESLRTFVSLSRNPESNLDKWTAMTDFEKDQNQGRESAGKSKVHFARLEMSEKSVQKFLKHLSFLKGQFEITDGFLVESGNNFPSDAGLASSASSFAALTKCFFEWLTINRPESIQKYLHKGESDLVLNDLMSSLSRRGSGSSCRSFYSPWSVWDQKGASEFHSIYKQLDHFALVVSSEKKAISSSLAHQMVLTSPHFSGRVDRAQDRIEQLQTLLNEPGQSAWHASYKICWDEFIDMHDLFHTCQNGFRYMTPMSDKALVDIQKLWSAFGDGPLVTMDAGPNIHFLFRPDQAKIKKSFVQELSKYGSLIESKPAQSDGLHHG